MKSPDQLDLASEYEAENLPLALERQRNNRVMIAVTGRCWNCGEPVDGKFCPPLDGTGVSECFTDFAKRHPEVKKC